MQRVEAKARFAGRGGASAIICFFSVDLKKDKSNTSIGTVNSLLFVCTHNINKTLCFYKIKKIKT